ncbi:hypothetical protein VP01_3742g1 [Puccinia sorghi]|uniref:Uncharacterized protein n=1 Tax=Puccinia sorghi TaxID=27349 RepID=A0A0L6UTW4_9BASI|nr:hypothetical protein VP01_3742g1 [Puccinia sorghi]
MNQTTNRKKRKQKEKEKEKLEKLQQNSNNNFEFITNLKLSSLTSAASHHVRMRKRPISDPRHYGRHLHKLRHSTLKPEQHAHQQPRQTPSEYQPKKRSFTQQKSHHPSTKTTHSNNLLHLPILPNLYDPSLPITHTYPNNSYHHSLTPPRKPLPQYAISSFLSLQPDPQQETISFPPSDYDGQFTFRLEMHHVCQRLLGLHLAISTDKKNRAVQIQEAMRIAMERLDPPPAPPDMPHTNSYSMGLHDQNNHPQDRLGETFDTMSRECRQAGRDIPHATDQKACLEHRRRTRRSSSSTTAHGPSGPPPSEPPPPLPQPPAPKTQDLVPAGKPQAPEGADGRSVQGARKNKKKGKKKRSAHANANNIHHRDNYVPSRLPASYPVRAASESAFLGGGTSEWARLRLEYESRIGRGYIDPTATGLDEPGLGSPLKAHCQLGPSPIARFFVEPDEWICSFCEYELWFGDPLGLVRVIKNRKDVLRRRRRAKERAARAASGIPPSSTPSHPTASNAPPPPPPPATNVHPAVSNEPNKIKKSKNNIPSTLPHDRPPQASLLPNPPPPAPRRRQLNDHDIDDRRAPLLPPPLSSRTCRPNRTEKTPPDRLPHQPSSTPSAS